MSDPVQLLERFGSLGLLALVLWVGMRGVLSRMDELVRAVQGFRAQLVAQGLLLLRLTGAKESEVAAYLEAHSKPDKT